MYWLMGLFCVIVVGSIIALIVYLCCRTPRLVSKVRHVSSKPVYPFPYSPLGCARAVRCVCFAMA